MSDTTTDLPTGWVSTSLGDIAEVIRGIAFPKEAKALELLPDHVACLRTTNVQSEVEWGNLWYIPSKYVRSEEKFINTHDILMSVANSFVLVGKVALVKNISTKSTLGAFIAAIRTSSKCDAKFVYFMLASHGVQQTIRNLASTTTNISNVNTSKVLDLDLPLPPLPEQRRIVAKIEELFSKLEAGVVALKNVKKELKRYRQAVLKHAFDGKLTAQCRNDHAAELEPAEKLLERIRAERKRILGNKYKPPTPLDTTDLPELPDGWVWTTVRELGVVGEQTVLTGPFGSNLGREDFVPNGVPLLTIGCLTSNGINLNKAMYLDDEKANELERYKLQPNDILFSRMATVGRAGIIPMKYQGAIFNYHLMRLRLDKPTISSKYFLAYVQAGFQIEDYLKEVNHGATRDGINTNQLLDMPVALAPNREQQEIVSEIERRFSVADAVEQTIDQALAQATRLRQSILKRAFAGQLVPQDPTDEPASILLDRIKAQRANAPTASKSRASRKKVN